MTTPIITPFVQEEKTLIQLRQDILEALNAHGHERHPRCVYWDLLWIQSCFNFMELLLTMSKDSTDPLIQDINLVIRKFFDDAFPYSPIYRKDPLLSTRIFRYAFDKVALQHREESTLNFDFEGTTYAIDIWETYSNVRSAFSLAEIALKDSVSTIAYTLDEGTVPYSRRPMTPTPHFEDPKTLRVFLKLQSYREFITGKDLAHKMICSPNTITKARKELKALNMIEEKSLRGGFRLIPELRNKDYIIPK